MPNNSVTSQDAALQVIQQAVIALADWADADLSLQFRQLQSEEIYAVVQEAKQILVGSEPKNAPLQALQLVFDRIVLTHGQTSKNYRPAWALEMTGGEKTPQIPYTQSQAETEAEFDKLKDKIKGEIAQLDPKNLAQLTLFLEKFGSHLSVGEPDIALIDQARSTAAVAAALAQNPPNQKLALVAGDLMGVQKFIYTISSDGALKSLRARSFFLEIATEEIVYRLLEKLKLPRTNIIYAGASKFYILAPKTDQTCQVVQELQDKFNKWLRENFQKKIFLAMAVGEPFPAKDLSPEVPLEGNTTRFATHWQKVNQDLAKQALRKFDRNITEILKQQDSHEPCKVCHRDDTTDLKPLNGEDSVEACPTCCQMFALGGQLLKAKALIRSDRRCEKDEKKCFEINGIYYRVLTKTLKGEQLDRGKNEIVFQINCWDLEAYRDEHVFPLLLGNYGQKSKEEKIDEEEVGFMSAGEFAQESRGIKRVGYLRMDVDQLGQIFGQGLRELHTLPRLMGLSRQMTYFFKVYLNSLAEYRFKNLPPNAKTLNKEQTETSGTKEDRKDLRLNLLFIYAGGDDLFVSGSWDEVLEFAFDLYQSFRAYTGWHPDITLSAGICIAGAKFPLYQTAAEAEVVEKAAKGNGRDSLGLFNAALKWDEWLGNWNLEVLKPDDLVYLNSPVGMVRPALFGVFPFIEHLYGELGQSYTRSFVRNLLNTAQMQEAKIKEAKEKYPDQVQDIRYYLHLPKVAYTLARLPKDILEDADFRKSLKSPYNAPYFRAIATWIELLNRNS